MSNALESEQWGGREELIRLNSRCKFALAATRGDLTVAELGKVLDVHSSRMADRTFRKFVTNQNPER